MSLYSNIKALSPMRRVVVIAAGILGLCTGGVIGREAYDRLWRKHTNAPIVNTPPTSEAAPVDDCVPTLDNDDCNSGFKDSGESTHSLVEPAHDRNLN